MKRILTVLLLISGTGAARAVPVVQIYSRLDDEPHGNDFHGDRDHKFDGL